MELNRLFDFLEQMYRRADVKAAFGEPQSIGDKTIIPVARVGFGVGLGFSEGERPAEEPGDIEAAGAGGGGAGGAMTTPVALLQVTSEDTKVIAIVDSTKLALAGILMIAWNLFWIARTIRFLKGGKAGE